MLDIIYNAIGSLGVLILLSIYFLLQTERLEAKSLHYSILNLLGSGMILISLINDFNFPSFLIELVWAVLSIMGILRYMRRVRLHD